MTSPQVEAVEGVLARIRDLRSRVADGLAALQEVQEAVSSLDKGSVYPTRENVGMVALAMIAETLEYADEAGWKPWKKPKKVDKRLTALEAADQLAFLGLQLTHMRRMGIDPAAVAGAYADKTVENVRRLAGIDAAYGAERSVVTGRVPSRLEALVSSVKAELLAGAYQPPD